MTALRSIESVGSPSLPETEYCQVDDYRVPFLDYGTPSSELPIAAFNGISMPVTHWGDFPDALAERGHRFVAFGVPEGPNLPAIPSMKRYVDSTLPVIRKVLGKRKYNIIAQSWGGVRAQETALRDPNVHRSVIAVSAPKFWMPPVEMPDFRALLAVSSTKRDPDTIAAIMGGDFTEDPASLDRLVELTGRKINSREHFRQMAAIGITATLGAKDIPRLQEMEMLFVLGEKDPIVSARGAALAAWIIGAEVEIIEGAGHGVVGTHTQRVADLAHEFFTAD